MNISKTAENARENARRADGKFGSYSLDEASSVSLDVQHDDENPVLEGKFSGMSMTYMDFVREDAEDIAERKIVPEEVGLAVEQFNEEHGTAFTHLDVDEAVRRDLIAQVTRCAEDNCDLIASAGGEAGVSDFPSARRHTTQALDFAVSDDELQRELVWEGIATGEKSDLLRDALESSRVDIHGAVYENLESKL